MTKAGGFARWADRDGITDFDLAIGDEDPHDQFLDQLPLLLACGPFESRAEAPAKLVHAQANAGEFGLPIHLRLQLLHLCGEALDLLLQIATPPSVFLKADHVRQIGLGEPLDLLLNAGSPALQRLPARLQVLRQPMAAMRPLESKADRR